MATGWGIYFWIIVGAICCLIMLAAFIDWLKKTPEQREFDKNEYKRICEEAKMSQLPKTDDNGQVKCPKCNSTQIQLVNRKWSPLTGLLTNKVDRVCVKCKHKF